MSIQWQNFNDNISWTPASVVNEVKRITQIPHGATCIEFLNMYTIEMNSVDSPIFKSMLKFCIFCWMYKMLPTCEDYDKEDIGIKVTESWDEFFDVLNHSAEVENVMPTSPCSIVANIE